MPNVRRRDGRNTPRTLFGVEYNHCICRGLLAAEMLHAKLGDMRTLEEACVRCGNGKCRSRKFTVTRFHTRSAAHAFMRNL
jgi:ribosomal protein S14